MSDLYVKPVPGRKVRRPERQGRPIPADGARVPANAYYHRRIKDGDLVRATAPKPATRTRKAGAASGDQAAKE